MLKSQLIKLRKVELTSLWHARKWLLLLVSGLILVTHCAHDLPPRPAYKTQRVIIVVVDGPRYQETWEAGGKYIPMRFQLATQGVLFKNFTNDGITLTNPGHTAICTGIYQNIDNGGNHYPENPSIFQYYLKQSGLPNSKCQIITSKDKLHVLSNCNYVAWKDQFRPEFDCGNNGPNSGYRDDYTTFQHALATLNSKHPDICLIQFKEPDASAHQGNWAGYLDGIRNTDQYVSSIWNFIQKDPYYAGITALFVTNDHGRHSDTTLDGFVSHGDSCSGCRKIELFAIGPDFKAGTTVNTAWNQTDLMVTAGALLGIKTPYAQGKTINELLK